MTVKHPAQMDFADVIALEEQALRLASRIGGDDGALIRQVVGVLSYHASVLGDVRRLTERR